TFRQGSHVAFRDGAAYMLTPSGLLIYDVKTGTERRFGRVQGFPPGKSTGLFYDRSSDFIFVTFAEGLIAYFRVPEQMLFIYDVSSSENLVNKTVYYAEGDGRFVYFSADFGLMAYDLTRRETKYSYFKIGDNPSFTPVLRHGFFQGRIYAHLKTGDLYSADLSNPNLADGAAWRKDFSGVKNFCAASAGVYVHADASIFRFDGVRWTKADSFSVPQNAFRLFKPLSNGKVVYIPAENDRNTVFVVGEARRKTVYDVYDFDVSQDGLYSAAADGYLGLTVYDGFMGWNRYESHVGVYHPDNDEPPSNAVHRLAVGPGEVYIAPGAPYSDDGFYRVDLHTGRWTFYPTDTVESVELKNFDRAFWAGGNAFLGAYERGVVELERGAIRRVWTADGGCFSPLGNRAPRLVGAAYDPDANLWMLLSDNDLPVLRIAPDGSCRQFALPGVTSTSALFALTIDDAGNKWVAAGNRIVVFRDAARAASGQDVRRLEQTEGRGGLPGASKLKCLALDKKGDMWIGSTAGVTVYYAAATALFSGNDASCPVYNFRCLLEAETVNDICIDGANRKWIATENSGVYLFDPDAVRQIAHYTLHNSPLPSNRVTDIEIEPRTGEVFFATDAGLVSFRASATEGADSNDGLYVYPNPVLAGYDGPICVYPSMAGSVVKILTPTGRLVRELPSEGGRTVWDGRDTSGRKIEPGVYVVLVSTDDGKNGGMAKFAVLGN
ncbi:MAG: hypothetical protein NZ534_07785, partial [Bacteroidia bacterium]|nr:hypothetical protein [Bacteroidia bacterium]